MAGSNVGVAGVTGAASHVKVYVQRVCGPNGCPTSAIVNAINAAADYHAAGNPLVALNLSLGGRSESQGEKSAILRADAERRARASPRPATPARTRSRAPHAIRTRSPSRRRTGGTSSPPTRRTGSGLDISAPGGYCYSNTTRRRLHLQLGRHRLSGRPDLQPPAAATVTRIYAYMHGHVDGRSAGDRSRGGCGVEARTCAAPRCARASRRRRRTWARPATTRSSATAA